MRDLTLHFTVWNFRCYRKVVKKVLQEFKCRSSFL